MVEHVTPSKAEERKIQAALVDKVVEVGGQMFDAATSIVFIEGSRFSAMVEALSQHLDGDDEKAEDLLLGHARIWPRTYAGMIPEKRRLRVISSILAEQKVAKPS